MAKTTNQSGRTAAENQLIEKRKKAAPAEMGDPDPDPAHYSVTTAGDPVSAGILPGADDYGHSGRGYVPRSDRCRRRNPADVG